jgi:hypothetical protein
MKKDEISKTIVYENGDVLNVDVVREALTQYWKMTVAEKKALFRMIDKFPECPDEWKEVLEP